MAKTAGTNKGHTMEEVLRSYFRRAGYYVVRGVHFVYEGFEVTDIDLWLYSRSSPAAREIVIVDCKNRRTPQAIERIFWTHGLKHAVNATSAVVATTDKRKEVKDFGQKMGILVLDGGFLARLEKSDGVDPQRLTEEEFIHQLSRHPLGRFDGDWSFRLRSSKSLLSQGLNFDNLNIWLTHAHYFAEQSFVRQTTKPICLRCFYLLCSFIAIAIDYILKEFSFAEQHDRERMIREGFTYGSRGAAGMKKLVDVTMRLVEEYADAGNAIANQVKNAIEHQLSELPTNILSEYFAKGEVGRQLFPISLELENLAMQKDFKSHQTATFELRAFTACLLDYWGIDRASFNELARQVDFSTQTGSSGPAHTVPPANPPASIHPPHQTANELTNGLGTPELPLGGD